MTKTAEALFNEDFAANAATLPGAGVPWLDARRAEAIKAFRAGGVPHRRIEDWKYSDLKTALEAANDIAVGVVRWNVASVPAEAELFDLADLAEAPEWVSAHLGKTAQASPMPAASLALARSGFAIKVAKNARIGEPLRAEFTGSGHGRVLVVLEEGAQLTLAETQPAESGFENLGIEIVVGANAHLTHVRIARSPTARIVVSDIAVRVARDASYCAHVLNRGSTLARTTFRITLKEPGAGAHLSGVSVLGGESHADVTTEIYHAAGETRSVQLFKHVVGGKGHAVYQGKITVAEGANGSDSRQTAKAILLGDRAEADLKPELEIFADDVKCAHGAAIGDLDADSLFYLRSRGVPEAEARDLLIRAFLEDALPELEDERLRAEFRRSIEAALPDVTGGSL